MCHPAATRPHPARQAPGYGRPNALQKRSQVLGARCAGYAAVPDMQSCIQAGAENNSGKREMSTMGTLI